jgi:hypothetical protein
MRSGASHFFEKTGLLKTPESYGVPDRDAAVVPIYFPARLPYSVPQPGSAYLVGGCGLRA